jgi:hypothetical protein
MSGGTTSTINVPSRPSHRHAITVQFRDYVPRTHRAASGSG